MFSSFSINKFFKFSAISRGGNLFGFDNIIATFVEISPSNFCGGISTFIPSNLLGKIKFLSFAAF